MKSTFKKRRYKAQETFKSKFENAIYKIIGSFLETEAFQHSLTKGEEREVPIINFLNNNLPETYNIVKGEIVDLKGTSGPQLDVMIYDKIRNIPFYIGDNYILPAEALLSSIEVKSKLTQEEIRKILRNADKLKSLKPFGKNLDKVKRGRDIDDNINCRYYHCVFAYDTDLSKKNWLENEYQRVVRVAKEENIDPSLVDRFIVLKRGLINPTNQSGKESDDHAQLFMYFYMHLLNYLERENQRRKRVPYLDYAGKMSEGWKKL